MSRTFRTAAEIEQDLLTGAARRRFIIPGVLPAGPTFLYGASGTGKTGIAVRTSIAVASGLQWAGLPVERGSVLYIAGEDVLGVKERVVAAIHSLGLDSTEVPLAVIEPPPEGLISTGFSARIEEEAAALAALFGEPVSLVVIDTLGACFGDESQDDARPASKVTGVIDGIARRLSCAVLTLHHTGKRGNDMRGSQVFFDRADAVIRVTRQAGTDTFLKVEKLRSAREGACFQCSIAAVDLETLDGPISVQAIRDLRAREPAADETSEERVERRKATDADHALGILASISASAKITEAVWKEACFATWTNKKKGAKASAFSSAKKKLISNGNVVEKRGFVSVSVSTKSADEALTDDASMSDLSASASAPPSDKEGVTLTDNEPPTINLGPERPSWPSPVP